MSRRFAARLLTCFALLAVSTTVACDDHPPMESEQLGFRGVAIEQIINPRTAEAVRAANELPPSFPPVEDPGKPASEVYQNVQVLGHVGSTQFARLMGAITVWVSPNQGCTYCHANGNFVEDNVYTKTVARRMIEMTRHINADWKDHVGDTGVTCYTCHRGQVVPSQYWFADPDAMRVTGPIGNRDGQNLAGLNVGLTSLPADPFMAYFARADSPDVRIQSTAPLPTTNHSTIKKTEWTYSLMIHMSNGLGVNCTYCHNSRSFGVWGASSQARTTAWYGIRMVRDLNENYLTPLSDVFPNNRKGPMGDVYKINCATCHQGVYKPLYGAQMVTDYPSLIGEPSKADSEEVEGAPADAEARPEIGPAETTGESKEAMSSPDPAPEADPIRNANDSPPVHSPRRPAPA